MRAVWEVRATGPASTHAPSVAAVTTALGWLRDPDHPGLGLAPHERAAWVWTVTAARVLDVATSPVGCSILIEADVADRYGPITPALLTAAVDTLVLDHVRSVPGITTATALHHPLTPTEETP